MSEYSKSHEREEYEKMGRGLWHSIFGLLLCWLPLIGLLFSISGFIRQMVRLTLKHRARLTVYLTVSVLSMVICVGMLIGEIFLYSRNPNVLDEVGHILWQALTGQTEYAWEQPSSPLGGGFDYSGYAEPGLGVMDGQQFIDPTDELLPEDDVYYDEEDEEFNPDDEDLEFEDEEFTDETFGDVEDLPSVKDIINEIKDSENMLQNAF